MALLTDALLVLDIEATCWRGSPPPGQQQEIIELGVCLLNLATGDVTARRSYLVRPTVSRVSTFCTKLTTLTQAQVDADGLTFAGACARLADDYAARVRGWGSWGAWDKEMLLAQCAAFRVPYPVSRQHVNLKTMYARLKGLKDRVGLTSALKAEDITFAGTHHRGDDDAVNTARLIGKLLHDQPERTRGWLLNGRTL